MCRPPFYNGEPTDSDEEPSGCDNGETCLCLKLAEEHPDHVWTITYAGWRKLQDQFKLADLRCPDYYGMYTFNDHSAYGVLEVLQNLILDFDEVGYNWFFRWAICEALAYLLNSGVGLEVMQYVPRSPLPKNFR
jgi:hypothetical protein